MKGAKKSSDQSYSKVSCSKIVFVMAAAQDLKDLEVHLSVMSFAFICSTISTIKTYRFSIFFTLSSMSGSKASITLQD